LPHGFEGLFVAQRGRRFKAQTIYRAAFVCAESALVGRWQEAQ